MRPTPPAGPEALVGRSRKSSFTDPPASSAAMAASAVPTTFFLADERKMEESTGGDYGIQSFEEVAGDSSTTTEAKEERKDEGEDRRANGERRGKGAKRPSISTTTVVGIASPVAPASQSSSGETHSSYRRLSQATISQPLTPLCLQSPALGSSMPSSPKSASLKSFSRHSDEESVVDDGGSSSQAIVSSGDEDGELPTEVTDSAPQLIMPSIRMPSRRPFTERGKGMGRLKVLIAGDSGIGKTSLIKSIVQLCEDIVHIDPVSASPSSTLQQPLPHRKSSKLSRRDSLDPNSTRQITEVYASTKPYPSWWSDFEESRVLRRRRKSVGDVVLERNLCFVDTPGYGNGTSFLECVEPVVRYVESQFERIASTMNTGEGDILGLLSGNGASQVDAVFYVVLHRVKPVDLEYIRRLSAFTNIIPIIAKADTLNPAEVQSLKVAIVSELQSADVRPFLFGKTQDDIEQAEEPCAPFAISSAGAVDTETMEASLLMSPDYVQPLVHSELAAMVSRIFDRDSIAWLRHSAAKKFVQWHHKSAENSITGHSPRSPLSMHSSFTPNNNSRPSSFFGSPTPSTSSQVLVPPMGATSSYALARVSDHTHREERMAQVRLAKWASDLQRSLQNERERFEALARGERAVWLTKRLGECVADGTLVPCPENAMTLATTKHGNCDAHTALVTTKGGANSPSVACLTARGGLNSRDPLGILEWNEKVRKRGWVAVQVLGSCGVVGGLALWVAKSWGYDGLVNWYWGWWGGGD